MSEWYNGIGYPSGLSQDDIPLGARILTIADAYDAIISTRPYRLAMERTAAQQIIRDGRGIQFDPKLTGVFLKIIWKSSEYAL